MNNYNQQQHERLQHLTEQVCEHIEVGHSGLMQLTPNSNVQIEVNAQVQMQQLPARDDQPGAQLVAVVLILNEHKEEQPREDISEQRGMGSGKCAPPLLFASSS